MSALKIYNIVKVVNDKDAMYGWQGTIVDIRDDICLVNFPSWGRKGWYSQSELQHVRFDEDE